ncbi:branched-chain amino acid ABC transporter permease [Picosynechococcus sp. PCC 7003]|uniref:branched-chain amino acid ABC transporter permease n=1 Tax=Picosynechococcus sp. PCC 7003 TaxID=374981 RepID=UPI0008108231|nr:branched-chain amino acid ABC transporter permease [Picosynechococcus sp. PCC 7003]ANV84806.1 branched-chain amino acid ABC transporter permease [Picosynechococcus sp. PCC 7003]
MATFLSTYGYLIVSTLLGALLGISVYLPLMAGQLSLATPGFYALGGYIAAILSTQAIAFTGTTFPLPWLLGEMALAGFASGIVALIIGVPVLRLRGIYLAIATIALVEIVRVLSLNLPITGGAVGIFGIPQPFPSPLGYLWLVGPLLIIVGVLVWRLENTKVGRAFNAIREDELAASAMGINPTQYKVLAFVLGAILAGIVGAIAAHFLNTWNARQGTFDASITYLAFVLVGGSRTFLGPILGGIVLTALPEVLRGLGDARLIFFGLLLLLGTIFYPQGFITPELLRRCLPAALKPKI